MKIEETIEQVNAMLPPGHSPLASIHQTRKRSTRLIAIEIAKYIVSNLYFRIIGPTYQQISDAFDFPYETIRGVYIRRGPLKGIFNGHRRFGVVPVYGETTLEYLKTVSPNTTMLKWTIEDIDALIGPKGVINLFYLTPDEVRGVLKDYARRKYGLRSDKDIDGRRD